MRFLEKYSDLILNGGKTPLAEAVKAIDIQSTADWYFKESEIYESGLREQFPVVASRFPVTYLEYSIPGHWKVKNPDGEGWITQRAPHLPHDFIGCLIMQEKMPDGFCGANPEEGQMLSRLMSSVPDPKPAGFRQSTFFYIGTSAGCKRACWVENWLDVDGGMLGGPVHDVHASFRENGSEDGGALYASFIRTYGYPVYFALALIAAGRGVMFRHDPAKSPPPYLYRLMDPSAVRERATGENGANSIAEVLELCRKQWGLVLAAEHNWPQKFVQMPPRIVSAVARLKKFQFKLQ